MAAPKANTFYKFVQKPTGRPKKYTPTGLWKKALQYFDWVVKNPLYEQKAFANAPTKSLPKMRAMTELAFCNFSGIDPTTFNDYKTGKDPYQDFSHISRKISDIIYQQKFEGAAAELLNPAIIARDLGLRERTELTGKDGKPLVPPAAELPDFSHLTFEQIEELLAKYAKKQT